MRGTVASTMAPTLNILMRLVRKNGSITNDDLIVINRVRANEFSLSYTYGDTRHKKPYTVTVCDRMLLRWMRIVIRLLENDSDPFASVQFDFPIMPSVLIEIDNLDNAYHTILDAVEFHADNWPENGEYDDMPPLVPISPSGDEPVRHLFLS